ncbi:hypothetical protein WDZ16_12915 [Pseudokineococcus marinus]|uniref:Gp28/Gp37-like domain-containing protein n=1 Tax=Pseudokineococcus marinus TaxID=351215 RepID=A0A849BQ10_9ACTN|nr:hypothetical protein [Pseudokineococcus marinus]NNH21636.1 hypothetical protein [Pseudokineococcus marinus]
MPSPAAAAVLAALEPDEAHPFRVRVYDRERRRLGLLGAPRLLVATGRHLGVSTATIEVPLDHPRATALQQQAARVEVDWRDQYLLGGRTVVEPEDTGDVEVLRLQVFDYAELLRQTLGWVDASRPIEDQGREYATWRGTTEGVVKAIVGGQFARVGLPVQIAPNLGRGLPKVTVRSRFDQLDELVYPLLEEAGLGLTIRPTGPEHRRTGLVLDVHEPPTYPVRLTKASGVVRSSRVSLGRPTATRVIVMGGGEGKDRDLRHFADYPLEAQYNVAIETTVDARDARSDLDRALADQERLAEDPDATTAQKSAAAALVATERTEYEAELAARGAAALAEGAPRGSASVQLSETRTFRFGTGAVQLGARLPMALAGGVQLTERLREVTVSWGGQQQVPALSVGDRDESPDVVLIKALKKAQSTVRRLTRR